MHVSSNGSGPQQYEPPLVAPFLVAAFLLAAGTTLGIWLGWYAYIWALMTMIIGIIFHLLHPARSVRLTRGDDVPSETGSQPR